MHLERTIRVYNRAELREFAEIADAFPYGCSEPIDAPMDPNNGHPWLHFRAGVSHSASRLGHANSRLDGSDSEDGKRAVIQNAFDKMSEHRRLSRAVSDKMSDAAFMKKRRKGDVDQAHDFISILWR
jgi:hypothetical protein